MHIHDPLDVHHMQWRLFKSKIIYIYIRKKVQDCIDYVTIISIYL